MLFQSWHLALPLGTKAFVDRLLFVLIFLLAFNAKKKFRSDLYPILVALAVPISFLSLWQLFSETDSKKFGFVPFFGNVNMGAQFAGICALFLILQMRKGISRWWSELVLVLLLVFIYFSGCRSVMLALIIAAPFLLLRLRLDPKALIRVGLATVVVVLGCRALFSPRELNRDQLTAKDNSSSYRLTLWRASLDMVKENPLGVGLGEYTFAVMPYKMKYGQWATEKEVDKYPHNEYVRFPSEDGVVTSLFIFLFFGYVLIVIWRIPRGVERNLFLGLSVFMLVEAFFQFPLENAFPFLIVTWMVGYVFKRRNGENFAIPKVLAGFLVAAIAFFASRIFLSEYWTRSESHSLEKTKWSCENVPSNWRGCVFYANNLINNYDLSDADRVLDPILERHPYHFPVLRLSAQASFRRDDWERGCLRLKTYDEVFGGQSPLHDFFQEKCKFLK